MPSGKLDHRWWWLTASVLFVAVVRAVPFLMAAPGQEPIPVVIGQFLVCGIILGIGRQGIDVLLLRLFGASMGLLVTAVGQHNGGACLGLQDCAQLVVFGAIGFGLYGTIVLALVAFPTTLIWNKGPGSLKPELPWKRMPKPRTWWQWTLTVLVMILVIPFIGVLLGIPWPG